MDDALQIQIKFGQSGDERRFVTEDARGVVVGMARLPVRQDQHSRLQLTNDGCDFFAIFKGIFDATVRNIEGFAPRNAQDFARILGFARAIFHGAARSHLSARKIKNGGGPA